MKNQKKTNDSGSDAQESVGNGSFLIPEIRRVTILIY
jgi:hypothetical protein